MTREKRCHVPGALYWIEVQGIAEIQAFPEKSDCWSYTDDVMTYAHKFGAKVLAFLVESNCAQLLIRVGDEALSKPMQCIQQSYSRKFNKKFDRKGAVFQTRYHSMMVNPQMEKEAVLLMAQLPIIGDLKNSICHQGSFFTFLKEGTDLDVTSYFDRSLSSFKAQLTAFHKEIIKSLNAIDKNSLKWHPEAELEQQHVRFIDIVDFYVRAQKVDIQLLRSNTKQKPYSDIRKAIIQTAHQESNKTQSFIADYFNISESTVSKVVHGDYVANDYVKALLASWKRREAHDNLAR